MIRNSLMIENLVVTKKWSKFDELKFTHKTGRLGTSRQKSFYDERNDF